MMNKNSQQWEFTWIPVFIRRTFTREWKFTCVKKSFEFLKQSTSCLHLIIQSMHAFFYSSFWSNVVLCSRFNAAVCHSHHNVCACHSELCTRVCLNCQVQQQQPLMSHEMLALCLNVENNENSLMAHRDGFGGIFSNWSWCDDCVDFF
jgi:hypothetical protein